MNPPAAPPQRPPGRRFGMPRRNWWFFLVLIAGLFIWQMQTGNRPVTSPFDLRTYSQADVDAARSMLVLGLTAVTLPQTCARDHQAYESEASWKTVIDGWNDRNEQVVQTVVKVLEDSGASRGRGAIEDEAKGRVQGMLAEWRGEERRRCRQFLDELSGGAWDFGRHSDTIEPTAILRIAADKDNRRH
ncbi:MAG: hypothetical protein EXQ85_03960 [Alphaproteobacteria bacterium]|nr:hypothetical protein [Alphaproteobacteria bacterium]